jgi:hypothetical protein
VKVHEALTEQSETSAASLLQLTRVELDDPMEQLGLVFLQLLRSKVTILPDLASYTMFYE